MAMPCMLRIPARTAIGSYPSSACRDDDLTYDGRRASPQHMRVYAEPQAPAWWHFAKGRLPLPLHQAAGDHGLALPLTHGETRLASPFCPCPWSPGVAKFQHRANGQSRRVIHNFRMGHQLMTMNLLKHAAVGMALVAAAVAAVPAHAAGVTLDVAGIVSYDEFGSSANVIRSIYIGPGVHITGLSWDVDLTADTPSWLSEMSVDVNDGGSPSAGVSLSPGFGVNSPGSQSFSGSADLVALGFDFYLGASGMLFFEFFETFDDNFGLRDGIWTRGSLTVTVPEPGTYGLAALALLGLGAASRRRPS